MSQPGEATLGSGQRTTRARIPFEPALEGLRGLVLFGLLCFHAEFSWATGGFLGIATFFTLSGFLLTSLFLAEWEHSQRIAFAAFWARRFRRLMPAALLTLLTMWAFGHFVATPSQLDRLRDDIIWALFYAANWHFLWSNADYTALFEAPSPLHHFWSLAVEEQFYFGFPLVVFAGLRLGRGSLRGLGVLFAALVAVSLGITLWLVAGGASFDRIYYGTDTRMAELLLGAVVAVVVWRRGSRGDSESGVPVRWLSWLGSASLLAMVLCWAWVDLDTGWLYRGGFAAYALLSATVIAAGVQPGGFVRSVLAHPVMQWLGRVSYGAYLFHWPIYLWLDAERVGLDSTPLFLLRVGVTLALAEASYRWFEHPIRTGRMLHGPGALALIPMMFGLVAAVAFALPKAPVHFDVDRAAMDAWVEDVVEHYATEPNPPPPTLHSEIPRIAMFGDSTATTLAVGLQYFQFETGQSVLRRGSAHLGCAVVRKAEIRTGDFVHTYDGCDDFDVSWAKAIREEQPDIAIVLAAPWDIRDRRLEGETIWRTIGDPILDRYYTQELQAAVDVLSRDGTLVLWLTHPLVEVRDRGGKKPAKPYAASDPARIERWNELIRDLERSRPGQVRVIDLRRYIQTLPGGEFDERYRPDATHLTPEAAYQVAKDWLADEIMRIYREEGARARAEGAPGAAEAPGRR
ncbi:MAG: acyltransferase family protein [Myxococcota bacterium]|nr:acyltransferase family protein [Myxococcota bacterium]